MRTHQHSYSHVPIAVLVAAGLSFGPAAAQTTLPGIVVTGVSIDQSQRRGEAPPPISGQGSVSRPAQAVTAAPAVPAPETGPATEAPAEPGGCCTVDRQGSAVSVVTREEIERQQVRHAADALRMVPGVSVSRTGGTASLTQVRIRGAEANHTLVMIDGVKANATTTGEFDFADLLADDIERIEVIRGPQSGLWGSNALAGVVNIVTRGGKGPGRATIAVEQGAFDTTALALALSGGNDTAWGAFSFQGRDSNGFNLAKEGEERDSTRHLSVNLKGGLQLNPFLQVYGNLRAMNKAFGFDDFGTPSGAVGPPAPQVLVDSPARGMDSNLISSGTVQLDLFDGRLVQKLTGAFTQNDVRAVFPHFGSDYDSLSQRNRLTYIAALALDAAWLLQSKHKFTVLAEKETEIFEITNRGFIDTHDERRREMASYAAEHRGEFYDRLFTRAAVRWDDSSAFDDSLTWSLAAAYKLKETGTRFHASVGTGVVFPTMLQQFGFIPLFFTPNPNLRPETSLGWDAGIEQTLFGGRLVVDVTYFSQTLENEIFSTFSGPPRNLVGTSHREGVELSGRIHPLPGLEVGGSFTWLDARDPQGEREIRRPHHAGSLDAVWRFLDGRAHLGMALVYNGRMKDVVIDSFTFAEGRVTLQDYTLLKLTGGYKIAPNVELFGRVENLLNQRYEEIYGVSTPGLAAYGGVRVTFEEKTLLGDAKR